MYVEPIFYSFIKNINQFESNLSNKKNMSSRKIFRSKTFKMLHVEQKTLLFNYGAFNVTSLERHATIKLVFCKRFVILKKMFIITKQ